ncbi:TIGR03086 family metal-binding protein [Streptomyces sp. NPDC004647]|uniref:TIGR03086 family metal-binding protein n=1 Tax=Streptomyces sp. NPDC004647 TaxID=3154671 RepID=UPI0033B1C346
MTAMLDLKPAARQMASLLQGITDDQLGAPTPCPEYTLGDLIDHVDGLSQAFTTAAAKDLGAATSQLPSGDATRLGDDWRSRIAGQLTALGDAWRDPGAWVGMTQAGGVDLPAESAGRIALDELVIHGWDIAHASGQPFDCDPQALSACMEFVSLMSEPGQEASREGLFGPVVDVPADAPLLDRVIALSGRDPAWTAV